MTVPRLNKIQLIAIVIALVIIFLVIRWIKGKLDSLRFTNQNKIPVGSTPLGTTISSLKGYVSRVVDDVTWSGEDIDVYNTIVALPDVDLIALNNVFVEYYADLYEYKYSNLAEMIESEKWFISPIVQTVIDRVKKLAEAGKLKKAEQ